MPQQQTVPGAVKLAIFAGLVALGAAAGSAEGAHSRFVGYEADEVQLRAAHTRTWEDGSFRSVRVYDDLRPGTALDGHLTREYIWGLVGSESYSTRFRPGRASGHYWGQRPRNARWSIEVRLVNQDPVYRRVVVREAGCLQGRGCED